MAVASSQLAANDEITITLSPIANTPGVLLRGAAHLFTATVEAKTVNVAGRSVTFESASMALMGLTQAIEQSAGSVSADITVDPNDPKKGTAEIYAIVPSSPRQNALNVSAKWNGTETSTPATASFGSTDLAAMPIQYGDPVPPFVPIVPRDNTATITPQTNPKNTLAYQVTVPNLVGDPATLPPANKLKSTVAIDIKQTGIDVALFQYVIAYDKDTNKDTDKIAPNYPTSQQGLLFKEGFVRVQMKNTDAGKKTIYLCATSSPIYARLALSLNNDKQFQTAPFFSYDLDGRVTYSMRAPTVEATFGVSGELLLDRVSGYTIPVVPTYVPGTYGAGSPILLLQNDVPVGFDYWPADSGQVLTMSVAKASIRSLDDDPAASNTLAYVAPSKTGTVSRSVATEFAAIGSPGNNQPDPSLIRDLTAPGVLPPSQFITTDSVQAPQISFTLPRNQPKWTAQVGDVITMEVWLNGYFPVSGAPKSGYLKSAPMTLIKVELDKPENAQVLKVLFESADFLGYDSRKMPPPETFGRCAVSYTVNRPGDGGFTKYSQIFWPFIDTVPPGQTSFMFKTRLVR